MKFKPEYIFPVRLWVQVVPKFNYSDTFICASLISFLIFNFPWSPTTLEHNFRNIYHPLIDNNAFIEFTFPRKLTQVYWLFSKLHSSHIGLVHQISKWQTNFSYIIHFQSDMIDISNYVIIPPFDQGLDHQVPIRKWQFWKLISENQFINIRW